METLKKAGPFHVPKLYLESYVKGFEDVAKAYGLQAHRYEKGKTLTVPGIINNDSHYIRKGIVHLSLTHSSGKQRSLVFFGPQTIFPLGVVPHENPIDYEMILEAFTDVEVYTFPYPTFRRMCVENGELAAQVLEENCDFIGYLFYHDRNHSLEPTIIRVCDILYLYETFLSQDGTIDCGQERIAQLVGISLPQLERVLKHLRDEGVITTYRSQIRICDPEKLLRTSSFHDGLPS